MNIDLDAAIIMRIILKSMEELYRVRKNQMA